MGQNDIANASASDINSAFASGTQNAFNVSSEIPDGAEKYGDTSWQDDRFAEYFGYYVDDKVPEITAVIDAKATWTVGKGYKADEETTMLLDSIRGWGKDTFNTILENAMRTMLIGGNFYAEIIRDEDENVINIKPLNPYLMRHVTDAKGMLVKFEQLDKRDRKKVKHEFEPEDIFYLARNRVADEIHGRGIIQKLKRIMDMKNKAMSDWDRVLHRNVDPMMIFHLDTDDPTEIANFKGKRDAAKGKGEDMYIPKDAVIPEQLSIAPNASLNPLPWINYLDNLLYQTGGVPKIVVGGSSEFTEKASSIVYLTFQQSVEEEQLFIEEQLLAQLNIIIDLQFPVSLENELLSDEKKDQDPTTVQPNETTAGEGQ